jgi:UDP-3-O-[3-hydroxymyristoyl] glucosamine N-acyltransferase
MLRSANFWLGGTGHGVKIHSTVVMGDEGFGFEIDKATGKYKIPLIRRPHPFSIVIGDDVEIGANSIVHRGRWRDTTIDEGTKIDSLVHVAHNVLIGKHCLIVAGSVIGGSVTIGDYCFIGENVSIKQGITIAHHVTIGMGSVVRHNIYEPNSTWAGNPCVKIADVQKF